MKNNFRISLLLIQTNLLSLKRYSTGSLLEVAFKRYGLKYPAEWIGILFVFTFFSMVFIGVSFEKTITINNKEWLNIIDINALFFSMIIILEFLLQKPVFNISRIQLKLFPISYKNRLHIKYLYEIFDKKIVGLVLFFIILSVFIVYKKQQFDLYLTILTYTSVTTTYLLTCSFIITFRAILKRKIKKNHSLFIPIISTLMIICILFYIKYIRINVISITHIFISLAFTISLCIILYFINLFIEKNCNHR